ncbi:hypothetical protein [Flavobacterium sp. DG2-3]|uniref:hypothetical protein n=1 Tax=Flavobacterium sp. DG2-3 TaxID=3068317 RepID=UPI00273D10AD|nr:hypothetical protein [Flavobacterium sp. DG2-3]MDP5200302.1 hypothetical protein [Flavobacterium sp. DG2-3]
MENTHNFSPEELQNCPYHQMLAAQDNKNKDARRENTGDWGDIDETDEAGTDPDRNEKSGSDDPTDARSGRSTNT